MAVVCRVVAVALVCAPGSAAAEGNCTTLELQLQPAAQDQNPFAPQIVAWLEKPDGTYVDTIFITHQTGTYGIGNRPGRFDFNSGPAWPYGRRITVFPVWAHRHGLQWDEVLFQNGDDSNLSHPFNESSRDLHFCRPLQPTEPQWDAMTCASMIYTDKGKPGTSKSVYPPRNDIDKTNPDDPSVDLYDMLNPFDLVSQATPVPGTLASLSYPVPEQVSFGAYTLMVEVSREFDRNAFHAYPSPMGIPWDDYGAAYRGQPSIVYRVPFFLAADGETSASTADYVGYGDPDGLDGNIRAPDGSITTDVPGSGASRLELVSINGETYRVRVVAKAQFDEAAPARPGSARAIETTSNRATIEFVAPGDDGTSGRARTYEIRYVSGTELTAETFDAAIALPTVVPTDAGVAQTFAIEGLLPETDYTIGIRATDDCRNTGELAILSFTTAPRALGEVDACFIATAAYGSVMANDVDMLRRFRDALMRKTALGELAVETYYTFSPALAGMVGESDLLRATARDLLGPIVERVRTSRVTP